MIIALTPAQVKAVMDNLAQSEDAEQLSDGGYTCDIYEIDPPVALELYPAKGGVDVAAAFILNYDDERDGYYLGDRLETPEAVIHALGEWPPIREH